LILYKSEYLKIFLVYMVPIKVSILG